MKNVILKALGAVAVAAGILGFQGSAQALKNVPFNASFNLWGAEVQDANPSNPLGDYVNARSMKTTLSSCHLDVTANAGGYQSALLCQCTTGTSQQSLTSATNTTNGDINLVCPGSGGSVTGGYGAIQY